MPGFARQVDQPGEDFRQLLVIVGVEVLGGVPVHPAVNRDAAGDQGRAARHALDAAVVEPLRPAGRHHQVRHRVQHPQLRQRHAGHVVGALPHQQLQLRQLGVRPPAGVGDDQQLHRRPGHAPGDLEAAEQPQVVLARLQGRARDDQLGQRLPRRFPASPRRRRRSAGPAPQDRPQLRIRAHVRTVLGGDQRGDGVDARLGMGEQRQHVLPHRLAVAVEVGALLDVAAHHAGVAVGVRPRLADGVRAEQRQRVVVADHERGAGRRLVGRYRRAEEHVPAGGVQLSLERQRQQRQRARVLMPQRRRVVLGPADQVTVRRRQRVVEQLHPQVVLEQHGVDPQVEPLLPLRQAEDGGDVVHPPPDRAGQQERQARRRMVALGVLADQHARLLQGAVERGVGLLAATRGGGEVDAGRQPAQPRQAHLGEHGEQQPGFLRDAGETLVARPQIDQHGGAAGQGGRQ